MRPGGNYVQPWIDRETRETWFIAYVGWKEVGRMTSSQEAVEVVRAAREGVPTVQIGGGR